MRVKISLAVVMLFGSVSSATANDTAFKIFRDVCIGLEELDQANILEAARQHDQSIQFTPEISLPDPLFDQIYDQKFSSSDGTTVIAMPTEGYDCEVSTRQRAVNPPSVEEFLEILPDEGMPQEPQIFDLGKNTILRFFPYKVGDNFLIYSINYDILGQKAKLSRQTRVSN